jgi:hypothetical protein
MHYNVKDGDVIIPKKLIDDVIDLRTKVNDLIVAHTNENSKLDYFTAGHLESKLHKLDCRCKDESTSKKRTDRETGNISK